MPYAVISVLFFCVFALFEPHRMTVNTVDFYASDHNYTIEGKIVDEPDRRPLKTKYTIAVDRIVDRTGSAQEGITGKVLVTDHAQWPMYEYGDRIKASGKLSRPEPIENFRYDNYLRRYNIYAVMYRGSLQPTSHNLQPSIRKYLYRSKRAFEDQINKLLPEPHASFMAGLLTGSRKGIPDDLMEAFNRTGLTHIIAISGYNISIVIALISGLLIWLPQKVRFYPAVVAICVFTIFVGASAAVVRAAIMGILGLVALQCGRETRTRLTIAWTALFMIAWNPKILFFDAGFQLSFLAVIGISELSPFLETYLGKLPKSFAIQESVRMTLAAQIATAPLIVLLFHRFSVIAPITNLLVAPVIPVAMLLGASATLVSYMSFPAGQLIAYGAWANLEWIIQVAEIGSRLPFASIAYHS